MSILHCVSSLQVGGAEKLVKNLSIIQAKSSKNVAILSFGRSTDPFQQVLNQTKVNVFNIIGGFFTRQIHLIQLIRQYKVIHIHSPAVIRAFIFIAPYLLFKKVIYTIHGEVAPDLAGMKLSHLIARGYVNATFAVSEKTRIKAQSLFLWPIKLISVVKNGVSFSPIQRSIVQRKKIVLGTVSRLIPLKQISLLIECVKEFGLAELLEIKIFGDGPEQANLHTLVKNSGLNGCISFMGNVINEEDIYPQIDCLVICSNTEGLPMVLLEAMAYSVPCISTKVGAIPDVVAASEAGWLFNVGDKAGLAAIINNILTQPHKLIEQGEKAKSYVMQHYSIESVNQTYQQCYGLIK